MISKTVGIIGSGLAGITSAVELGKNGIDCVIVEKSEIMGGNTRKAATGLSAISDPNDSLDIFYEDIMKSGDGLSDPDLVKTLVENSEGAIAFLEDQGIEFSRLILCGGHSYPRLHSPSSEVMKTGFGHFLINHFSSLIQDDDLIEIMMSSYVVDIIKNEESSEFEIHLSDNNQVIHCEKLIIATGGFCGDVTQDFLTNNKNYEFSSFPTTNHPGATGEVLEILERNFDANLINMEEVQVTPSGIMDPKDRHVSKTCLVASDGFRGYGGILVDSEGNRFVDELETRKKIADKILEHGEEALLLREESEIIRRIFARLIFNDEVVRNFGVDYFGFYKSQGIVFEFESLLDLVVSEKNMDLETMISNFENSTVLKPDEKLYMMHLTPACHYSMGGLQIDTEGRVLMKNKKTSKSHKVIDGLFAAGECTGGVHGKNRLGGNSLLECTVFGQICAKSVIGELY